MIVERKEILDCDGSLGYVETVFRSDNILKTTYFPKRERLYIAFSRGDTYSYSNISQDLYEEFESAESHGKFFHKRINNRQEHQCRKEFTLYPSEVDETRRIILEHSDDDDE